MQHNVALVSDYSLSTEYQRVLREYPLLDAAEEQRHALRFYEQQDLSSAQTLVLSNLRGVLYVARQYHGYGLPYMDLVQEGVVGLMRAVKRFNPYRNVRLFAYAIPWIKAEIQSYIVRNWKLVKAATTDAKKKLFFGLRSLKNKLLPLGEATNAAIAQSLGVPLKDVEAMNGYMSLPEDSLDAVDDVERDTPAVMMLAAPESDQPDYQVMEAQREYWRNEGLQNALETLDARARNILEARYLSEPPATLQALSARYGVSMERIRQIEMSALKKLQKVLPRSV